MGLHNQIAVALLSHLNSEHKNNYVETARTNFDFINIENIASKSFESFHIFSHYDKSLIVKARVTATKVSDRNGKPPVDTRTLIYFKIRLFVNTLKPTVALESTRAPVETRLNLFII